MAKNEQKTIEKEDQKVFTGIIVTDFYYKKKNYKAGKDKKFQTSKKSLFDYLLTTKRIINE